MRPGRQLARSKKKVEVIYSGAIWQKLSMVISPLLPLVVLVVMNSKNMSKRVKMSMIISISLVTRNGWYSNANVNAVKKNDPTYTMLVIAFHISFEVEFSLMMYHGRSFFFVVSSTVGSSSTGSIIHRLNDWNWEMTWSRNFILRQFFLAWMSYFMKRLSVLSISSMSAFESSSASFFSIFFSSEPEGYIFCRLQLARLQQQHLVLYS